MNGLDSNGCGRWFQPILWTMNYRKNENMVTRVFRLAVTEA